MNFKANDREINFGIREGLRIKYSISKRPYFNQAYKLYKGLDIKPGDRLLQYSGGIIQLPLLRK